MSQILILRHGESEWNAMGLWQGWANPALSQAGQQQCIEIAQRLVHEKFDHIISSDLLRAIQSAQIIASVAKIPTSTASIHLRERNIGLWSGYSKEQIHKKWSHEYQLWRQDQLERPPEGESHSELMQRVIPQILELLKQKQRKTLIISHGGVMRGLQKHLTGTSQPIGNLNGFWLSSSTENKLEISKLHFQDATPHTFSS